jgi:hypothetical protein
MLGTAYLPFLFLGIGVIFLILYVRDYMRNGRKTTIAGGIRLKMAIIFSVVGVALLVLKNF